jgi:hypothetical protein
MADIISAAMKWKKEYGDGYESEICTAVSSSLNSSQNKPSLKIMPLV